MKKQLIVALAFSICAFSFAQKKELRTAEKAIKSNNYSEAKAALNQAKSLMSVMDAKTKAKYYYLNGQALYANGAGTNADVTLALENLDKVEGAYTSEITTLKQTMVNGILTKGNTAFEKKDFATSSKYFESAYRLSTKDTLFLYYAASTAVSVKDYDRALGLYEELKKLDYTGIETQYFAINVKTEEEDFFDNKITRDFSVKSKTHIKPTEKVTKSKKAEIVKNIALIYVSNGDNEKALQAMKDARNENPEDTGLLLAEANIHLDMGNKEEFSRLLRIATEKDPDNAELQYNLGVIAADFDDVEGAKKYYSKAIELDSNYINAYINMSVLILNGEQTIIEEMNSLGSSKADDIRYDELKDARQNIYATAIPFLTKAYEIDSKNVSAIKTLMNIYSAIGETDKYKSMKEVLATLEVED